MCTSLRSRTRCRHDPIARAAPCLAPACARALPPTCVASQAVIDVACLRCCDAVRIGTCSSSAACAAYRRNAGAGV